MMNIMKTHRVNYIRELVKQYISDARKDRREELFLHLNAVSYFSMILARRSNLSEELAAIAGLLHDIYTVCYDASENHALLSSKMTEEILIGSGMFIPSEISLISNAIANHSNKNRKDAPYDEILKNADCLELFFRNPENSVNRNEERIQRILDTMNAIRCNGEEK